VIHFDRRGVGLSDPAGDLAAGSGIGFSESGRHQLKRVPDARDLYRVGSTPRSKGSA
jgi:hypothetical protein